LKGDLCLLTFPPCALSGFNQRGERPKRGVRRGRTNRVCLPRARNTWRDTASIAPRGAGSKKRARNTGHGKDGKVPLHSCGSWLQTIGAADVHKKRGEQM